MTFITLAESKIATKGNIVVTVTKIGDLKSGTTNGNDWTRKDITVKDSSGSENMSVWNDDIKLFQLDHMYELSQIYWKENNGKHYLNFGQYSQINNLGTNPENGQAKIEESDDDFLKQKQEQIKNDKKELDSKLDGIFTDEQTKTIEKEIDIISAIELLVTNKLKTNTIDPNPAKIGMYMKFIYDKIGHFQK